MDEKNDHCNDDDCSDCTIVATFTGLNLLEGLNLKDDKPKFEVMKVFDCQDMPDDLCTEFLCSYDNKSNDVYVNHTIHDSTDPDEHTQKLDAWLVENGAEGAKTPNSSGEEVIIAYWW